MLPAARVPTASPDERYRSRRNGNRRTVRSGDGYILVRRVLDAGKLASDEPAAPSQYCSILPRQRRASYSPTDRKQLYPSPRGGSATASLSRQANASRSTGVLLKVPAHVGHAPNVSATRDQRPINENQGNDARISRSEGNHARTSRSEPCVPA